MHTAQTAESRNLRRLAKQLRDNADQTPVLHFKNQMQKLADDLDIQAAKLELSLH